MRRKLVMLAFLPLLLAAAFASGQTTVPACQFPKTCPGYESCAGWSNYYPCDPPFCRQDAEGNLFLYQKTERYRVCFRATGQSCTEYMQGPTIQTGSSC